MVSLQKRCPAEWGGDIEVTCLGPIKYLFRFYPLLSSLVLSPPYVLYFLNEQKKKEEEVKDSSYR